MNDEAKLEEVLCVSNLTKTFSISGKQRRIEKTNERTRTAVNGLSFTAYKGEIFGLLGPNGAGKTTTLRIISTLLRPDSGNVTVSGISAADNPSHIRSRIGFLTSELKLEASFTPNYLYGFFSDLYGVAPSVRNERQKRLFEKFGIDKFAEVKIGNLSSGMKQKVSLVISVVHDPDIIIFDEPTNGLDVLTAKVVTDFLLELKEQGKSIILSTHIFNLAEKLCDRIGIIINGNMTLCETLKEITASKPLEDVFFDLYAKTVGDTL